LKLTKFTNIFNAELAAILQTLKILYSQDEMVEIVILSDSKSSIQAIINHRWEASPLISEIIQLIYNYRYAGCNVVLHWIPSHCGCPGNETADNLASDRASSLTGDTWTNSLSSQEILNALKQKAQQKLLTSFKTTSSNLAITNILIGYPLARYNGTSTRIETYKLPYSA
jgi:ribonuclease HI